jgi:hypothetical protein
MLLVGWKEWVVVGACDKKSRVMKIIKKVVSLFCWNAHMTKWSVHSRMVYKPSQTFHHFGGLSSFILFLLIYLYILF